MFTFVSIDFSVSFLVGCDFAAGLEDELEIWALDACGEEDGSVVSL